MLAQTHVFLFTFDRKISNSDDPREKRFSFSVEEINALDLEMREEKQNLVRLRNKTANSFLLFGDILLPCKEILLGPHHVAPLDPCQNAKGD